MLMTPFIQVDKKIMLGNIKKMHKQIFDSNPNIIIRPHIKTHKIPELAKLQFAEGANGITTAKIAEAEMMVDAGIEDIFIAYPIVTIEKAKRLIPLQKKLKRLILSIDSIEGAKILSQVALENNTTFEVRVEINTGLNRSGILPVEAVSFCQLVESQFVGLNITGIFTFRGAILNGLPTNDIYLAGVEEAEMMVDLSQKLSSSGILIKDISVGSTQTGASAATVPGITEVRIGTYIFNDVMQVAFDLCDIEDCAAAVKVTVVSMPNTERAIIDGGSKTFATDVQPIHAHIEINGFGYVKEYPEIIFERMNEEHGILKLNGANVSIGETLTIIPNHICSTVNLHNTLLLDTEEVTIIARGKLE